MKCPFCAEQIRDEAIKCKHCGSMLQAHPATLAAGSSGSAAGPQLVNYKAPPAKVQAFLYRFIDVLGAIIAIPVLIAGFGAIAAEGKIRVGVLIICSAFLFAPKLNDWIVDRTWGLKMSPPVRVVAAAAILGFAIFMDANR